MPAKVTAKPRTTSQQALPPLDDDDAAAESDKAPLLQQDASGASSSADSPETLVDEPASLPFWGEARSLFKLAWPMTMGFVLQVVGWQANLIFIGHLGAKELGACAMANMFMNICGMAILFGGQMALDTFRSQAFGAGSFELVGTLSQRGLAICTLMCVPVGASWWFGTYPVLRLIGVDDELASMSQTYTRYAIGMLWPMLAQNMAVGFLRCQRIVQPVTWLMAACNCVTLPLSYGLIQYFGFIGGAIAQSVNFWFILFATLGMIKCKGYHKKCWG